MMSLYSIQRAMGAIQLLLLSVCLTDASLGKTLDSSSAKSSVPAHLRRWLGPQVWERGTAGPVVELGQQGSFDDTHIFAPCVAFEGKQFRLWYSGSTGRVAERVFHLGLATSKDGRTFVSHANNPVYSFGDGKHSVLTATLLRSTDGRVLREDGKLRMWFSATHFAGSSGLHTLHESFSQDGVAWSQPSAALLEDVYAPTILKQAGSYRMWYTDVSQDPWVMSYAESHDGRVWSVNDKSVLTRDQSWEQGRLFYPTVVQVDGVYLMWYGSYWSQHRNKTALGFAVSLNGQQWFKHPQNPILRPDPRRPWESHYTTSQSVIRLPNGGWRIWYASRNAPPFVNKYFAINTATWQGPRE